MNKKNLTKNNKKSKLVQKANFYGDGKQLELFKNSFKGDKLAGTIGTLASGVLSGVQGGLEASEVDTSVADNALEAVNNYQPNTSSLDAIADSLNSTQFAKTDWTGRDFTKSTGEQLTGLLSSGVTGFASGAASRNVIGGAINAGLNVLGRGLGWASSAVRGNKNAKELNRQGTLANIATTNKTLSAIDSTQENAYDETMRNLVAYGGPIYNLGGEFDNGLMFIDEGGTHEQNPFGGVLMGVDNEGTPNLVEEGEIIYNDYVFSNRLKPNKKLLKDNGFSDKYEGWTFAKIVEDLQKESAERPNDIISKAGLDDMMGRMITMQENIRAKKGKTGQNKMSKMMAEGGNIFDGENNLLPTSKDLEKRDIYNNGFYDIDRLVALEESADILEKVRNHSLKLNKEYQDFKAREDAEMDSFINLYSRYGDGVGGKGAISDTLPSFPTSQEVLFDNAKRISEENFNNKVKREVQNRMTSVDDDVVFDWGNLGMLAPSLFNIGKSIYNAAKPIEYDNVIAEQAFRKNIPIMQLPRVGGKQVYRGLDKNRFYNPVMNAGRATARDVQNLGTSSSDVLNRLALNSYNTQKALGEIGSTAEQQDLANRLQVGQFNLGIDQLNNASVQAEQQAAIQRGDAIARGAIADASTREQLAALKGQAIDKTSTAGIQGLADLLKQQKEWSLIENNEALAPYLVGSGVKSVFGNSTKDGGLLTRKKRRK